MVHASAPALAQAGQIGQHVDEAGGQQHAPGSGAAAVGQGGAERPALAGDGRHFAVDHPHGGISLELGAADLPELGRQHPVARHEAVDGRRDGVARRAAVHEKHAAPGPPGDQGGGEPGRPTADDQQFDIVTHRHTEVSSQPRTE